MREELKEAEAIASSPRNRPSKTRLSPSRNRDNSSIAPERIFSESHRRQHQSQPARKSTRKWRRSLPRISDAIRLNGQLFARIEELYNNREKRGLDAGVEMAAGALLQGFRPRRGEAFRAGQDKAEGAECRARDPANHLRAKCAEGKKCLLHCRGSSRRPCRAFGQRNRRRRRRGERGGQGRQVRDPPLEHQWPAFARLAAKPRAAREHHADLARAKQPRRRMGQQGNRQPHRKLAGGTREACSATPTMPPINSKIRPRKMSRR